MTDNKLEKIVFYTVVGTSIVLLTTSGAMIVLGFGSSGIVKGSLVAAWQAKAGNLAAGSLISVLQSLGAKAVFLKTLVGGTPGAVLGAAKLFGSEPKKEEAETGKEVSQLVRSESKDEIKILQGKGFSQFDIVKWRKEFALRTTGIYPQFRWRGSPPFVAEKLTGAQDLGLKVPLLRSDKPFLPHFYNFDKIFKNAQPTSPSVSELATPNISRKETEAHPEPLHVITGLSLPLMMPRIGELVTLEPASVVSAPELGAPTAPMIAQPVQNESSGVLEKTKSAAVFVGSGIKSVTVSAFSHSVNGACWVGRFVKNNIPFQKAENS